MTTSPVSWRADPADAWRVLPGVASLLSALALMVGCAGPDDPTVNDDAGSTGSAAPPPAATSGPDVVLTQPPVPSDPAGYTQPYVQETLGALFHDYRSALLALQSSGEIDDTVRAAMAEVYHPSVYDQQVRNLEDYYPGGENLEEPMGEAVVQVTALHSATPDCILAITSFNPDGLTTLDAPTESGFFIGLARNPDDADVAHPWLITAEYSTSDGEPLPEDVCA